MATRPVFFPLLSGRPGVRIEAIDFRWNPGVAPARKRLNVAALHGALRGRFPAVRVLEASSKSGEPLGVALSAFRLAADSRRTGGRVCVESLYQGSKVFAQAGPFPECYGLPALEARERLKPWAAQPIVRFDLHGESWPLTPRRAFYDWLYVHALRRNPVLAAQVGTYQCFTDIEFNPARSVNCQAYAVALYVSLAACGVLAEALRDRDSFLRHHPADETPALPPGKGPAARVKKSSAAPARRKPEPPRRPVRRAKSHAGAASRTTAATAAFPAALPLFDAAFPQNPEPAG